jgi:LmbE family N-acetylglucosaminyl deacetylase
MGSVNRCARVYLSPHLDDAVLSCGGRIWQEVQAGKSVTVVTVFAAGPEPGASLSSYAQTLHARWGQPSDAVEKRQQEDREALALLGAEAVHWPYRDCIYRRTARGDYAYASEEALWGRMHPADEDLIRDLTGRIRALPLRLDGTLYVPLAVGQHVDHRIVRGAAEQCAVAHDPGALTYYEDFPYAQDPRSLEAAMLEGQEEAELVPLSHDALEAKIAAVACYRSQLSTFWDGRAEMAAALRAFAEQGGNGVPVERYWRVNAP